MTPNLRPLGRSGVAVSPIGFGCGPTAALMTGPDRDLQRRAVERAITLGVTTFDTAASYAAGQSERNLGHALAGLHDKVAVCTKVTLEADDLNDIAAAIIRSVEASLRRLGVERLHAVHLHNRVGASRAARPNLGSGVQLAVADVLGPVAETLAHFRAQNLIGCVGCCAYGGEHDAITQMIDSGAFQSLLAHASLLNQTAWADAPASDGGLNYRGVAHRAANRGMGVVALRILDAGALTQTTPAHRAGGERLQRLERLADQGLVDLAIRHALTTPGISMALIGFSTIAQIEEAARAAARGPLSPAMMSQIASLGAAGA